MLLGNLSHFNWCSPSLLWHIWSCKKVSNYWNVLFLVIWHFGLKCHTIEIFKDFTYFNVRCHLHTQWRYVGKTKNLLKICSQYHTVWSKCKIIKNSHDDVFTISYIMKVRICCLLMMFVDVGNWDFVRFIHKILHVRHICNQQFQWVLHCKKIDGNWTYSWASRSLTIGVG